MYDSCEAVCDIADNCSLIFKDIDAKEYLTVGCCYHCKNGNDVHINEDDESFEEPNAW